MSRSVPLSILEALQGQDDFVVATHVRPDADAIGSSLACCLALRQMGKKCQFVHTEGIPEICRFLPGADETLSSMRTSQESGMCAVVLDCEGLPRAAISQADLESCTCVIVIDHHVTSEAQSVLQWVEPEACATGELLYQVLVALGVSITPAIATNLYAAITTDTGWFRFGNTSAKALTVCASLVAAGADVRGVARHLFEERSVSATRLLGRALMSLQTDCENRLVWSTLEARDFEECQAAHEETEGIINHIKAIRGSEVALLFSENNAQDVRVSLRAEGDIDVSMIAGQFGGGGHSTAAGCTLSAPLCEAQQLVLAAVRRSLICSDKR